jgi:hypothetical protein
VTARKPATTPPVSWEWLTETAVRTAAEQGFGPYVTDPEALRLAIADPSWITKRRGAERDVA